MGVMAFQYKVATDSPILVAYNREERPDRPSQAPRIQSGCPRIICGIDRKAGGTWFGINQHGMFACAMNRFRREVPYSPRSRGLLCREMLNYRSPKESAEMAVKELQTGNYAGVNFVVADANQAFVVYGGTEVSLEEIKPGLHMFTAGRMDDYNDERQEFVRRQLTLQRLDSSVTFLAVASKTFAKKPDPYGRRGIVLVDGEIQTVSGLLLSLPYKGHGAVLQCTPTSPSDSKYEDVSALLRQVLSTDRNSQKKVPPPEAG
ncbi:MAG: NRDE family protein [Planctomycetia bacterium]|nr:NRDE family protein [Planctomycetia bacterium]